MGVFPSDARGIHAALASTDKTLELVPGAHYFEDSEANRTAMVDLVCALDRGAKLIARAAPRPRQPGALRTSTASWGRSVRAFSRR